MSPDELRDRVDDALIEAGATRSERNRFRDALLPLIKAERRAAASETAKAIRDEIKTRGIALGAGLNLSGTAWAVCHNIAAAHIKDPT